MKCFINTCNNDANYLIQSHTPIDLFKFVKNYLYGIDNKSPICSKCLNYICWDYKLYSLDGKRISDAVPCD